MSEHIASITEGLSFAYLKEAYIASLLTLGWDAVDGAIHAEEEDDRRWGRFGNLLQKQAAVLRKEMAEADQSEAEKEVHGVKKVGGADE